MFLLITWQGAIEQSYILQAAALEPIRQRTSHLRMSRQAAVAAALPNREVVPLYGVEVLLDHAHPGTDHGAYPAQLAQRLLHELGEGDGGRAVVSSPAAIPSSSS